MKTCTGCTERDATIARLRKALRGVMELIVAGKLVRNTSDDANPDWAMRQMPFVIALAEADAALADTPQPPKPCIGEDPTCPCQDGDMCHYEGPDAWPIPDTPQSKQDGTA